MRGIDGRIPSTMRAVSPCCRRVVACLSRVCRGSVANRRNSAAVPSQFRRKPLRTAISRQNPVVSVAIPSTLSRSNRNPVIANPSQTAISRQNPVVSVVFPSRTVVIPSFLSRFRRSHRRKRRISLTCGRCSRIQRSAPLIFQRRSTAYRPKAATRKRDTSRHSPKSATRKRNALRIRPKRVQILQSCPETTPAAAKSSSHTLKPPQTRPNPPATPLNRPHASQVSQHLAAIHISWQQIRLNPPAYAPAGPKAPAQQPTPVALNAIRGLHSMLGTRCAATGAENKPLKEATNGG